MNEERIQRRLAAILAADVVGYSRMMGEDEAGTRARLNAALDEVVRPALGAYRGRLFKTMGDGLLAEFASVVDAVDCAVAVQARMAERAVRDAEGGAAPLRLRIGVNLGDVILEDEDVHGDGVNVAARLETLAEPGGVCISRAARDQVRDKLAYRIEDMGMVEVKNIARPVRAFQVRPGRAEATSAGPGGAGLGAGPGAGRGPRATDRPSVAVLPFEVRGAAPSAEDLALAEGVAEDLARALARVAGLAVVDPSAAASAVQDVEARAPGRVGEALGVRNLVRGALRRSGGRARLDAELIDAASARILWSDRIDSVADDPFDLQDAMVHALASGLAADLPNVAARHRFTEDIDAHLAWATADRRAWRGDREGYGEARALAAEALERDPGFTRARAMLAFVDCQSAYFRLSVDTAEAAHEAIAAALGTARLAVAEEPEDWYVHAVEAQCLLGLRDYEAAFESYERAVALEPSNERLMTRSSLPLIFLGRTQAAEARLRVAMRLNPYHDWLPHQLLGQTLFLLGREAEAAVALEKVRETNPNFLSNNWWRAGAYGRLGEAEKAAEAVRALRLSNPGACISGGFVQISDPEAQARFEDGLRRAGLPD